MKLVRFLMKLANKTVSVETKQDTVIQGTVVGCDMSMNIHLKKCKVTSKGRQAVPMDHMTVRGANIRSVVLPADIPLDTLLENTEPKKKTAGGGKGRGRGRPAGGRGRGGIRKS